MHQLKRKIKVIVSSILLCTSVLATACQMPINVSTPTETNLIAPSGTAAFTPASFTEAPTTSTVPALTISSSIQENAQVVTFDESLQPIHRFAGGAKYMYLSTDQCWLESLSFKGDQISIHTTDYDGNTIGEKTVSLAGSGTRLIHSLTLSPDGVWIAYKETSGDYGRSYEDGQKQDVKLISSGTKEPQTPIEVSERSGAKWSNLSWSPDAKGLLYTDFDHFNRHQVFLINAESGYRTQVTELEADYMISDLEWSPDAKYFTYTYFEIRSDDSGEAAVNGHIGLVQASDFSASAVVPVLANADTLQVIWGSGNRMLILEGKKATRSAILIWYDVATQSIIASVESSIFEPEGWIYAAFPLRDDLTSIGLLGSTVHIYNFQSGSSTTIDNKEVVDWFLLGDLQILRNAAGSYRSVECNVK